MINFKHIKKSFKGQCILKDISFSIKEGEIIRISGSNGCGKSTLLKIAVGLLEADEGNVFYEKYEDSIGALIENPSFIENESAMYNLKFLYNLKNKFDLEKVKALMKDFLLDPLSTIPVKKYSVGMRQKLGIIQAIMEDQKIIFLDEPTRGLDDNSVDYFYKLIDKLHNQKMTIVICSHEKLEGIIFDKEYFIDNGTIVEKI
jgi:ABC-type multidrug transport system, ATPase component